MKLVKKKQLSIKSLDAKLWKIVSKYIRLRDSENGICKCITCNKIGVIADFDAGHFISRNRLSTKFNEQNINAQCQKCNRFLSGVQYAHGLAIDKKYGRNTARAIYTLSRLPLKINRSMYIDMIEQFKIKLINLEFMAM